MFLKVEQDSNIFFKKIQISCSPLPLIDLLLLIVLVGFWNNGFLRHFKRTYYTLLIFFWYPIPDPYFLIWDVVYPRVSTVSEYMLSWRTSGTYFTVLCEDRVHWLPQEAPAPKVVSAWTLTRIWWIWLEFAGWMLPFCSLIMQYHAQQGTQLLCGQPGCF